MQIKMHQEECGICEPRMLMHEIWGWPGTQSDQTHQTDQTDQTKQRGGQGLWAPEQVPAQVDDFQFDGHRRRGCGETFSAPSCSQQALFLMYQACAGKAACCGVLLRSS